VFTFTLVLGAACWTAGNLVWLAEPTTFAPVPWWIAFLVLTIAAERLELSRFLPPSPLARTAFAVIVAAILCSLVVSLFFQQAGSAAQAAGLLALSLWLVRQDIARRTIRERGLTRFIAVCLLSGYVWLGAGAMILLADGILTTPGARDAGLHAILLGFVFSMVFGHAPIIFPAVLRVAVPYHPVFYGPLVLLHFSLLLRLGGDALSAFDAIRWGALASALAMLAFVGVTVSAVVRGRAA
jgi:hypothetical protein